MRKIDFGKKPCITCGTEFQAKNGRHIYCTSCSASRLKKRNEGRSAKKRTKDPEKARQYDREWYAKNRERSNAKRYPKVAKRRERNDKVIIELKSHPCLDCGGIFPSECMDFDHVPGRGTKEFEISVTGRGASLERLLREVAKCELVCSNCHRIRTFQRRKELKN